MLTPRGRDVKDYYCLSTDDKPTRAVNGSLLLEMDTGDMYAFDAENSEWHKVASEG